MENIFVTIIAGVAVLYLARVALGRRATEKATPTCGGCPTCGTEEKPAKLNAGVTHLGSRE